MRQFSGQFTTHEFLTRGTFLYEGDVHRNRTPQTKWKINWTELNWFELLTEKFNTNDYTNSVNIQSGLFLISLIEKVNWNKCKEWKTETKKEPHSQINKQNQNTSYNELYLWTFHNYIKWNNKTEIPRNIMFYIVFAQEIKNKRNLVCDFKKSEM